MILWGLSISCCLFIRNGKTHRRCLGNRPLETSWIYLSLQFILPPRTIFAAEKSKTKAISLQSYKSGCLRLIYSWLQILSHIIQTLCPSFHNSKDSCAGTKAIGILYQGKMRLDFFKGVHLLSHFPFSFD